MNPKESYKVTQQDQQFGQPSARLYLRFYKERDSAIVSVPLRDSAIVSVPLSPMCSY